MPPAVNLIFIHGISSQTTGYSNLLFDLILKEINILLKNKYPAETTKNKLSCLKQYEILWADITTDLVNRYLQLQFELEGRNGFWWRFLSEVDSLILQILYYVQDKGQKDLGKLEILKRVDEQFQNIENIENSINVIISHSLGTVIIFDYIFGFKKVKLDKSFPVEFLFTLGSPLSLFISSMGYVDSRLTLPSNVKNWINILDPQDPIARLDEPHFKNIPVDDVRIKTTRLAFFLRAHTYYWKSRKLAKFLAQKIAPKIK